MNDPRRDHQQIVLWSFYVHASAFIHSEIFTQIFFCEDLSTLALARHLSVVFPPECQQDRTLLRKPILFKWNISLIFDIKSSTKHARSDQIETTKTITKIRPRITWRFYQWLRLPFLKKYRSSAKRFRLWITLYSELKRHNVSHYIYYLATDNIHIVLENDNTVLIKGLKKVVKC